MLGITWQTGFGVVAPGTREANSQHMRAMHGAGQMRRDSQGRLRHANGKFAKS